MQYTNPNRERQMQRHNDSWLTYWSVGDTPRERLKEWERSKIHGDTRECYWCGEEFDLEEFWDGFRFRHSCQNDRTRAHKGRQSVEKRVAEENRQMGGKVRGVGGGPLSKVKDSISSGVKGMVAKPAAKMAGKAASNAASNILGDEAGPVVGKLAEQTVQKVMAS